MNVEVTEWTRSLEVGDFLCHTVMREREIRKVQVLIAS